MRLRDRRHEGAPCSDPCYGDVARRAVSRAGPTEAPVNQTDIPSTEQPTTPAGKVSRRARRRKGEVSTRAHRLALRPGAVARRELARSAWARRLAFNAALAWHRDERKAGREVPGEFATAAWLRAWRIAPETLAAHPDLAAVPARVFEYAAEDLEGAWKATRKGAGRPRFDRFDPRAGGFAVDGWLRVTATHLHLPRMAPIRIMPHRRPGAKHGTVPAGSYTCARVVREHGEWFAVLVTEAPAVPFQAGPPTLGLDWGVRKLATLSDGTVFATPLALAVVAKRARKAQLRVQRKQRAADKRHGGPRKRGERRVDSGRLQRARRALGKQLAHAAHVRCNAVHHATKAIAARGEHVAAEALRPRNMTRRRVGKGRAAKAALNRRILDAAPGLFLRTLAYKLAARGRSLVLVNPAYTSQDCSRCGGRTDCGASETFTCAACGSVIDRDHNAAKNILARALLAPGVPPGWHGTKIARGAGVSPARLRPSRQPALIREREEDRNASK